VLQGSAVCFFNTPIWMTEKRTFSSAGGFFYSATNNAWRGAGAPLKSEVLPAAKCAATPLRFISCVTFPTLEKAHQMAPQR
jgi:hypothetical protein